MHEHPRIGALHRLPLRPIRRSLNEGLQSDWASWSGTPRQIDGLQTKDASRVAWWFSHGIAACIGATIVLWALT